MQLSGGEKFAGGGISSIEGPLPRSMVGIGGGGLAFPETTGDDEGEPGGRETIASSVGTVIQWALPGFSSLPGHLASLEELNQRRRGWTQSRKAVEDPEKAKEQTS